MNLKSISKQKILLLAFAACLIGLAIAEPALAGPGGLIKQATNTFWGKMVLLGLVLFFLPLIILNLFKRARLVKKTRQALRELSRQAPHFEWMRLKERISEVFLWVHEAWDQKKMEVSEDFMTSWYMQNQQIILDKWERDGLENIVSDVRLKKITPIYVACDPRDESNDRIVVEINAEMRDYLVDQSGKVVTGDKTLGEVTTVWSFVRDEGKWLLSMIEEQETVGSYLEEPDMVPEVRQEQAR